ncbi:hypothetical protein CEXT_784871 [Caerostris extrusa]|uniref:Uncharacterized protein n=1 Tax=Caerostris extrusa TaxID=172846 RepID=A0AAV4WDR7_CAEEX|nr:hypothetical protein CEXT_784871 [Caerostris extrusa]
MIELNGHKSTAYLDRLIYSHTIVHLDQKHKMLLDGIDTQDDKHTKRPSSSRPPRLLEKCIISWQTIPVRNRE